ncbi:transcriptional regulator with HTH domain and aminotransferase domain [Saccharomonospora marina XMU15]|uniref:Transcriptional regulator with HTH domain and aminotransferase domain n=1 Tax=Saccharomonospora marina XMU15 TaxID=882083 RepID=H5X9J0_9PSEU|nr:PLP-dependent aminotransferase family protein [Saccharomonospora marina]EHR50355.1 transcriptional regulator with HTH domain and aminotransferase domain [Saccharomonospora marina XMU15]
MRAEVDRFRRGAALAALLGEWSTGPGPLYRKLADALSRVAEEGALEVGERLPSERELARSLAVSRSTVVAAYDELRARDVLDRRRGSGTRVNGRNRGPRGDGRVRGGQGTAIFQRLIDGPGPAISLACAADEAAVEVGQVMREVVAKDLDELLSEPGYHPHGLPALRQAIAERYTRFGLPTTADEVLVTTGAHQALGLLSQVYLRPGATVVTESPSWSPCLDIFREAGVSLVAVPLDEEGIDPNGLAAALAEHEPALLYVMPSFHNPAGVLMSSARRRAVAELASRHGVAVVEDNAYAGQNLSPTASLPAPLGAYAEAGSETLTLESFKGIWGGLRIGWIRGPVGIIERCARRKALADLGSPVFEQAVAARLVPRMEEIGERQVVSRRQQCALLERLLADRLAGWTWRRPDGGSSLWVRLPDGASADVFAQLALRHGVEVIPGSTMDPSGAHDDHLRIPFARPRREVEELVDRLALAWTELRRHGPREETPIRPIV